MIKRLTSMPLWIPLLSYFAIWRTILFWIGSQADSVLKYEPSFPYAREYLFLSGMPKWFYSWGNFDGVHYIGIALNGYVAAFVQAFFPIFPLSIRVIGMLVGKNLTAGLLISNSMAALFFVLWYYFIKSWTNSKTAALSLVIISLFPTALFLGAIYSESLFMVLILICFKAASQKRWLLAGALAGLASATRIVGICLVPALIIEWADQQGYLRLSSMRQLGSHLTLASFKRMLSKHWSFFIGLGLATLGLAAYMLYLTVTFHDPLSFLHVQGGFGAGRESTLVMYPQVVWRSIKILMTSRPVNLKYFVYVQEFVAGVGGGLLLLWTGYRAYKQQLPRSWWIFAVLAFILPTTTGTFSSLGRYVLVCFIFWPHLAEYLSKHRWLMIGYLLLSTFVLLINTILFVQGYWVA